MAVQRSMSDYLFDNGLSNTMDYESDKPVQSLIAGGVDLEVAKQLMSAGLNDMRLQGVLGPIKTPWH